MITLYTSIVDGKRIPGIFFEEAKEAHKYSKLFGSEIIQAVGFDDKKEAYDFIQKEKGVIARNYLTQ